MGDGTGREAFAGYVDEYDWELYFAVEQRFERDLARYNVNAERCEAVASSARCRITTLETSSKACCWCLRESHRFVL